MCLIPKEEVLFHTDGKNSPSPREGTRCAYQRHVVLGEQGTRASLAVTPLLVSSVVEENIISATSTLIACYAPATSWNDTDAWTACIQLVGFGVSPVHDTTRSLILSHLFFSRPSQGSQVAECFRFWFSVKHLPCPHRWSALGCCT